MAPNHVPTMADHASSVAPSPARVAAILASLGLAAFAFGCPDGGGDGDAEDAGDVAELDGGDGTADDSGQTPDGDGTVTHPDLPSVTVRNFGALSPYAENCSDPGATRRIPFYFVREGVKPVVTGDSFRGVELRANESLGAGAVQAHRVRFSPAGAGSCSSAGECSDPFTCGASGVRGARRQCVRSTGVELVGGSVRQDYEVNEPGGDRQLVTVLFENTGSYDGKLPQYVARRYGEDGEIDTSDRVERATDPQHKHREAIRKFSTWLASAESGETTKMSLWFYGGTVQSRTRPLFESNEPQDHFYDDLDLGTDLVTDEQLGSPAPLPANLYQAIHQVVDKDLGLDKYDGREKFLVVVTDGPNEVWDDSATAQSVRSLLEEHGIHLTIMHLDRPIDGDLLRDDPRYWAGNASCRNDDSCEGAPACESDGDCANFETCRTAKLYPEDPGGSVSETDQKYCLPDYSDGQLGPIDAYADLTCATRGQYLYLEDPQQLVYYARRLPFTYDGQWSVKAEFSALRSSSGGISDGFYRVSGVWTGGALAPGIRSVWSALGSGTDNPVDTRGLIRAGGTQ